MKTDDVDISLFPRLLSLHAVTPSSPLLSCSVLPKYYRVDPGQHGPSVDQSAAIGQRQPPQALTVEAKVSGSIVPSARDLRKESSAGHFFTLPILSSPEHPPPAGTRRLQISPRSLCYTQVEMSSRMIDGSRADIYLLRFSRRALQQSPTSPATDAPCQANCT